MPEALFIPDGDRFAPTSLAAGPWSPDALHGGAIGHLRDLYRWTPGVTR